MSLARHIRDELGIETSDRPPDRITYSRDLWPRHHIAVRDGRIAEHALLDEVTANPRTTLGKAFAQALHGEA